MAATVSRGARRFVVAGLVFLVAWQAAALLGAPRQVVVAFGLYGFVLHTLYGKAVSLVPSYFERRLAFPRAPTAALPLTALGALGLAAAGWGVAPITVGPVGAVSFALGTAVVVGTLGWTVRDNLTGRETGTGEAHTERRPVDRVANAAVPVALVYLLVGAYATAAGRLGLPTPIAYPPAVTHLLAVGGAALAVFAVGFRLLPRFLVAHPPRWLVPVVLAAGAVGPALLALGVPAGPTLEPGAALEAVAVVGFALAMTVTFRRSDRRRVGLWGVLTGVWFGVVGVGLGVLFALDPSTLGLVRAHLRVNLLGFLGLVIVGASYQFYPPSVATARFADDRTAAGVVAALGAGILFDLGGRLADVPVVVTLAASVALMGALVHGYLLLTLFHQRY